MSVRVHPTRIIPGRTIPIGGSCSHGTAAALANMRAGSTVVVCRPADLTSTDAYMWSRAESGQVYRAFRFTGTQVRHFVTRGTTNYNLLVDYAALPALKVNEWVVIAHVWDTAGAVADQRVYASTLHGRLTEARAYNTRTVGAGALADDSALTFRQWARGGSSNGLVGVGHSTWIKRDYKATLDELQAVADAMLGGLPLDILDPTGAWYSGLNGSGTVYDYSQNANHGTLSSTTDGAAPPMRWTRRRIVRHKPSAGGSVSPTGVTATTALGTPVVSGGATVTFTGLAATTAVGTPAVAGAAGVSPAGLSAATALGTPVVSGGSAIAPAGVATTTALGTPVVSGGSSLAPVGVEATAALGTPAVSSAGGVTLSPSGLAATTALGIPVLSGASAIAPAGLAATTAVGSPVVTGGATVLPTGLPASAALGTPFVSAGGAVTLSVVGIAATGAIGTPVVSAACDVTPAGLAVSALLGVPVLTWGVGLSPVGVEAVASLGLLVMVDANAVALYIATRGRVLLSGRPHRVTLTAVPYAATLAGRPYRTELTE